MAQVDSNNHDLHVEATQDATGARTRNDTSASGGLDFPVNLILTGRSVAVVGNDRFAAARVHALAQAGAAVTVYAPDPQPVLEAAVSETASDLFRWEPSEGDLTPFFLVVAVTQDDALIALLKRSASLLSVMDRPADSTFSFPSILRRGPLTVAVSTSGTSPAMARMIRERIESTLGPEWAEFARIAARIRQMLKDAGVSYAERIRFFERYMASDVLPYLQAGRPELAMLEATSLLTEFVPEVRYDVEVSHAW